MRTPSSKPMADILIVDDEADIRSLMVGILEDEHYGTGQAENSAQVFEALGKRRFDLVVLDIWLKNSEYDGLAILEKIRADYPDLPVVMISGHGTIETAVKAIKIGAYDFIEKPFKTDRLLLMIERALETAALRRENALLKFRDDSHEEFIGQSGPIQTVLSIIEKTAPTNSRVMITGAAGTGKEAAARLIHQKSLRAKMPFMVARAAGLTPQQFEEKLFGREDKNIAHPGILERANGGTVFFDEIGDLTHDVQGKLLRLLQEGIITRLGGTIPVKIDARVLAASARDLEEKIAAGEFRQDLYYRLNVVPIALPRLSERKEDIPQLIEYFWQEAARKNQRAQNGVPDQNAAASDGQNPQQNPQQNYTHRPLSEGALVALQGYVWPGNVRQLKNLVEWLEITTKAPRDPALPLQPILTADLPQDICQFVHSTLKNEWQTDMISLPLREAREVFEREYLLAQITRFNGNISRTAQFVGMERSALHRKLKLLHIRTNDREEAQMDVVLNSDILPKAGDDDREPEESSAAQPIKPVTKPLANAS